MSERYAQAKARLDEIAAAVADEDLPLDDALALYEEAVKLGSKVSSLIESDIEMKDARDMDDGRLPASTDAPDAADPHDDGAVTP